MISWVGELQINDNISPIWSSSMKKWELPNVERESHEAQIMSAFPSAYPGQKETVNVFLAG